MYVVAMSKVFTAALPALLVALYTTFGAKTAIIATVALFVLAAIGWAVWLRVEPDEAMEAITGQPPERLIRQRRGWPPA